MLRITSLIMTSLLCQLLALSLLVISAVERPDTTTLIFIVAVTGAGFVLSTVSLIRHSLALVRS